MLVHDKALNLMGTDGGSRIGIELYDCRSFSRESMWMNHLKEEQIDNLSFRFIMVRPIRNYVVTLTNETL